MIRTMKEHVTLQHEWRAFLTYLGIGLLVGAIIGNLFIGALITLILVFISKRRPRRKKTAYGHEEIIIDSFGNFSLRARDKVFAGIIAALMALVAYFFRPWFHDIIMIFYRSPVLIFLILFALAALVTFFYGWSRTATAFGILAGISLLIVGISPMLTQLYIVQDTEYRPIASLPDSDTVRILPKQVAERYLHDSLQISRERIGTVSIANLGGDLAWIAPRVPDGTILYFTEKVNGVMIARADTSRRETSLITKRLEIGEEIGIFDNIYWNVYKKKYFIDTGEIYYIWKEEEETLLTIVPLISYRFRFPVMIPYYSGALIVHPDGTLEELSPEDVMVREEFEGNRAYPAELARLYVDSYKYHLGILNALFFHRDQIEIADVYGERNRQPFLMETTEGLKWVIATEPYGTSYGIFKIFLVDARSGEIEMLEMDETQTLTGPVRVVSYVLQEFPIIDWSASRIIEPRPYVVNNTLYWMLSITPRDYAGIAYTVFVNSENNDVLAFREDGDIFAFITEGQHAGRIVDVNDELVIPGPSDDRQSIIDDERIGSIEDKIERIEQLLEEIKRDLGTS